MAQIDSMRRWAAAQHLHGFGETPTGAKDYEGGGGYKYRLYSDGTIKIIGAPQSAYAAGKSPIGAVFKAESKVADAIQNELLNIHGVLTKGPPINEIAGDTPSYQAVADLQKEFSGARIEAGPAEIVSQQVRVPEERLAAPGKLQSELLAQGEEEWEEGRRQMAEAERGRIAGRQIEAELDEEWNRMWSKPMRQRGTVVVGEPPNLGWSPVAGPDIRDSPTALTEHDFAALESPSGYNELAAASPPPSKTGGS